MRSLPEPSGLVDIDGTTAQLSARKAALRRHCAVLPENGVGMPKIVITHNVAIAGMADRVIHISSGRIVEETRNAVRLSPAEIRW